MRRFYKGVILLAIAAFLGESLEFVVNMLLANYLGEVGLGLYMSILPVIFLVVVISSMELPISVSKFVAAKEEKFHASMLYHAIKLTIVATIGMILIALIVLPNIPVFNQYHPFIKWAVILLIPIVSFASIVRGYFMGLHKMGTIAISNFLRKAIQLILLTIVYKLFHFPLDTSIFIAVCTLIVTELLVAIYLLSMFALQVRRLREKTAKSLIGRDVRKSLLEISIPTTSMRIFHSVSHAVQPFIIKIALLKAGLPEALALEQFGLLAGVALTIGFFPGFIAHSLLIVLIPTVSEAHAKKDFEKLRTILQQVMILTFVYGIPSVILFYYFAVPLTNIFFEFSLAANYLQLLWPYFLFHFFVIPMQAFLIGLGMIKDAFLHAIWSTIIGFSMILLLGSMQSLQMNGVIIGMNAGIVLLTLMHYLTICNKIGVTLWLRVPNFKGIPR
ncbi:MULTISPECIES: oligosaccharide flippase family protein [Bacillus]|uniref:oligosaccharide flippase family protein n=1 Tax=Bacillus TaxID=1386 RepID=UPI000BB8CC9A|nr:MULTISPECIES: oligosaccharide flippase family protein [Bacillus]